MGISKDSNEKIDVKEGNMKKYILIICAFIILIAIGVVMSQVIIKSKMIEYEVEEISQFSYFTLFKNQKYGVIDKLGNIIIEPNCDMVAIPNPSKPVFVCYYDNGNVSEDGEYNTKVFNENKEQIFTEFEEVLPLMFQDSTTKVPYEKGVLKYKKDGKYGLMDYEGKKVTNADYNSIDSLLYKEGYLIVSKDEKYGIINARGTKIIDIKYDTITADGYYTENEKYKKAGFIIGNKTESGYQYGYINYKGDLILDTLYNEIDRVTEITDDNNVYLEVFKNGQAGIYKNKRNIIDHQYEDIAYNITNKLFIVQKLSKQGIVSLDGNKILNPEYDTIFISANKINAKKDDQDYIFDLNGKEEQKTNEDELIATNNNNYFVSINKDEKYGVVNKDKAELIKNEYQYIEYLFKNYFIVTKDGKIGVLNDSNETKVDFTYDVIQKIDNSNMIKAITTSDNTVDLYNENMEKIVSMKNALVYNKDNYVKIVSDTDFMYFDRNGNNLENKNILNSNSLFAAKQDQSFGFVDNMGQLKVEAKYDMVTEFNEYGFAGIKQNDKWGVINNDGKVIIEPIYTITWQDPEFVGKYVKVNFGYGLDFYTDELVKD